MLNPFLDASVSSGTLVNSDLLEKFVYALTSIMLANSDHSSKKNVELVAEASQLVRQMKKHPQNMLAQDDAEFLVEDLHEALNEYAPEGYYFGAHPGDGADFGFWKSEE